MSYFERESAFVWSQPDEMPNRKIETTVEPEIREARTASIRESAQSEVRNTLYDALAALKRGNHKQAERAIHEALDGLDQY